MKTVKEKRSKGKNELVPSTSTSANGTPLTRVVSYPGLKPVEYVQSPVTVSNEQFENVITAHKHSVNLLDSCGNALLVGLESAVPPQGSGRTVGEYSGQNMRQMAKSVCDIINTKTSVIRAMHSITRDEM